ncbi:hypothetical protein MRX96_003880 [Rhipicephalus microplus]
MDESGAVRSSDDICYSNRCDPYKALQRVPQPSGYFIVKSLTAQEEEVGGEMCQAAKPIEHARSPAPRSEVRNTRRAQTRAARSWRPFRCVQRMLDMRTERAAILERKSRNGNPRRATWLCFAITVEEVNELRGHRRKLQLQGPVQEDL